MQLRSARGPCVAKDLPFPSLRDVCMCCVVIHHFIVSAVCSVDRRHTLRDALMKYDYDNFLLECMIGDGDLTTTGKPKHL